MKTSRLENKTTKERSLEVIFKTMKLDILTSLAVRDLNPTCKNSNGKIVKLKKCKNYY